MYHVRRLAHVLKELKEAHKYSSVGGAKNAAEEHGIILDYCSLWQRHGDNETRSEFQLQQFKEGLKEINTPYAHQDVTAIKLISLPTAVARKYDDRGWTLFESWQSFFNEDGQLG